MPRKQKIQRLVALSLAIEEAVVTGNWDEVGPLLDERGTAIEEIGSNSLSPDEHQAIAAANHKLMSSLASARQALVGQRRAEATAKNARSAYSAGASRDW